MNLVFADSLYWIALTHPRDQWHQKAVAVRERLSASRLVTTEDILVEFLTYFGARGPKIRQTAALVARSILDHADVDVIPHTTETFLDSLALYEARLDKSYGMVDCMSMEVMRRRGLTDMLTHDRHFAQEGFNTLL